MEESSVFFKGGKFINRYLIKANLVALTPFHIGDGTTIARAGMEDDKGNPVQINAVATDSNGRSYVPGSSLRGAIRSWLKENFDGMLEALDQPSFKSRVENIKQPEKDQADIEREIKIEISTKISLLEKLFGSQFNEGKVEVWDAYCFTEVCTPSDLEGQLCYWNKDRLTYVTQSVAIDPETGTADEHKLYNYELVPAGTTFRISFSAQNLSNEEISLLLSVIEAFNNSENPITLGSMTKLDYGRFKISDIDIYRIDCNNLTLWKEMGEKENMSLAGYSFLENPVFKLSDEQIAKVKENKLPERRNPGKFSEEWELKLFTPLVIRSGTSCYWVNSPVKKARNYNMKFLWKGALCGGESEVGDLYHSVKIINREAVPYYHIPSSSLRGALRAWTIQHLLPKDWWDISEKLKTFVSREEINGKPDYLDNIVSLFGFVIEGGEKSISEDYTKAGRLIIRIEPFAENAPEPDVDKEGSWAAGSNFGPANARRHVKPRNPLDRITQAAKEGGLHNRLEFSKGQKFKVKIEIKDPADFDRKLVSLWKNEIQNGMLKLGGLTSVGRGVIKIND